MLTKPFPACLPFASCRLFVLQMVCQATTAPDERIRIAAFSCLHEIAANYYSKLPAYMQEVFAISVKAINEDVEEVGLQVGAGWLLERACVLAMLCCVDVVKLPFEVVLRAGYHVMTDCCLQTTSCMHGSKHLTRSPVLHATSAHRPCRPTAVAVLLLLCHLTH